MPRIDIDLPDDLIQEIELIASRQERSISALISEILRRYVEASLPPKGANSIKDIPPGRSLGKILKPWASRGELLEDFYDREE